MKEATVAEDRVPAPPGSRAELERALHDHVAARRAEVRAAAINSRVHTDRQLEVERSTIHSMLSRGR